MNINKTASSDYSQKMVADEKSYADSIRDKRRKLEVDEATQKFSRDFFENSENIQKVHYATYEKFEPIRNVAQPDIEEMKMVLDGYYTDKLSKDEVIEFFTEYCTRAGRGRDEAYLLNVYESFLNQNYERAVKYCFDKGTKIAAEQGVNPEEIAYYDSNIYYQAEEIHDLLKQTVKEIGATYGIDVDIEGREQNFTGTYITGTPNFNDKWDYMANFYYGTSQMLHMDTVPPKNFSFFYSKRENLETRDSNLTINGEKWTTKINIPYKIPATGRIGTTDYFNLASLLSITKEQTSNYKEINEFLKKFVVKRRT